MKTITIINPTGAIKRWLVANGHALEWVQTCRSSTCNCVSHDSGYHHATITLSQRGEAIFKRLTVQTGGSVHSHPDTRPKWETFPERVPIQGDAARDAEAMQWYKESVQAEKRNRDIREGRVVIRDGKAIPAVGNGWRLIPAY